jgi:hypothetical protein
LPSFFDMDHDMIRPETMIPDLLRLAPQVRGVLDRYGLRGCGGELGPMESLAFFAGAHEVPLPRLLAELQTAAGSSDVLAQTTPSLADRIYRPFFLAGIAIVLTLGAAWGAYLLLRIALAERFTAVGLHEVNAHGHAQIFGWVGLFVMGFAFQAFPRFKHTNLAYPGLAFTSGFMMLAGILVRSVGEPLVADRPWLLAPVQAAAWLEVAAIALFAGIIVATWRQSGKPLAYYDGYIASALFWFVVQAVYDALYLSATLAAIDREQLLGLVALWQGPLREIQIHGFALLMILGVSQRMFHYFYGFPAPSERLSRWLLPVLNLAIVGEVLGLILMRTRGHAWASLWYGSSIVLAGAVIALVLNWRIFGPAKESDRSLKFMRAAYAWLFVSLAMLLLLPAYQFVLLPTFAPEAAATQTGFSHAYYGAIRHAITVGFVSLMIVGVAAKVVPTLNGVDVRGLSSLWGPFLLLNVGCSLRVFGQVTTDLTAHAFPFAGVSGCLEVAGLTLWGWHLGRLMLGWRPTEGTTDGQPLLSGQLIHAQHRVGDVLALHPHLLATFLDFGFKPLASPWLRNTMARRVTIAQACRFVGIDADEVLLRLNQERTRAAKTRISLPLIS